MNMPQVLVYRTILAQFAALIVLWIIFTFKGLSTAVDIWWNNEIFNHGFLIIPVSFYLIWVNRADLRNLIITPTTGTAATTGVCTAAAGVCTAAKPRAKRVDGTTTSSLPSNTTSCTETT